MVLFTISEVMFFLRSFILVYYRLLALCDVGALLIRAKKHTLVALILTIILAFLFTVYWWRGKYIMKKIFNENENGSIERAPQIKARPTQYRKTNNTDKKKDTQIASPQPKIYRQKGPILTDLNDEEYKLRLETLIADLEMKEQLKIETYNKLRLQGKFPDRVVESNF